MVQKIKKKVIDTFGIVHIQSTFNNTIVTICDLSGNTIACASAGSTGFKGARKGTPFAAQVAAEKATLEALGLGLKRVEIFVKGQGLGREAAVKAVKKTGLFIVAIKDITPTSHNGCRPRKRRRV